MLFYNTNSKITPIRKPADMDKSSLCPILPLYKGRGRSLRAVDAQNSWVSLGFWCLRVLCLQDWGEGDGAQVGVGFGVVD